MLLARNPEPSLALAVLEGLLLEVGEEVVGLLRAAGPGLPAESDAGPLADILELLADHGWRPAAGSGATLSGLWERLAGLVGGRRPRD